MDGFQPMCEGLFKAHASDWEKQRAENSTVLFPGRISVDAAQKLPMTFVLTSEFDFHRRDALEVTETLKKAGRLAGLGDWPGAGHGASLVGDHPDYLVYMVELKSALEAYCN